MPDERPIVEPEGWTCDHCGASRQGMEVSCRYCGDTVWVRPRPIVENINQSEKWLEEFNKRPLMERLEWMLEPETMNISRRVEQIAKDAISEINRLTKAIEVCEERRWEAEEHIEKLSAEHLDNRDIQEGQ